MSSCLVFEIIFLEKDCLKWITVHHFSSVHNCANSIPFPGPGHEQICSILEGILRGEIAVLDMNAIEWNNYDKEACAQMMGRKGHISLEVHNSNLNHWLGKSRWWPGAVARWKNIFIKELD